MNKEKKRFQECNKLTQIWRYRWYLLLPILWVWHSVVNPMKCYIDEVVDEKIVCTNKYEILKNKHLWKTLIGMIQSKMNWYYTMEEVRESIKKR